MDKESFEKSFRNIHDSFLSSRQKIRASDSVWRLFDKEVLELASGFIAGKPVSAEELQKLRSIWHSESPFADENGNPFVFYIHDFSRYTDRVFHVTWCSTLVKMEANGREKKYVKKSDLNSNKFKVDYGEGKTGMVNIPACENCRKKMAEKVSPAKLEYVRHNMDIARFFRIYGTQDLIDMDNPFWNVDYCPGWKNISRRKREEANWRCTNPRCQKDCSDNKKELHVHHKDGVVSNCSNDNLQVLCWHCHAQQPFHAHMYASRNFKSG